MLMESAAPNNLQEKIFPKGQAITYLFKKMTFITTEILVLKILKLLKPKLDMMVQEVF